MHQYNKQGNLCALVLTLQSFSGSKDKQEEPRSNEIEKILTLEPGWFVEAQEIDPPIIIRGVEVGDLTTLFEECDYDDIIKFIPNQKEPDADMMSFPGSHTCDPSDTPYLIAHLGFAFTKENPGFFATSADTGELTFWSILEISEDKLVIQAKNQDKTFTDRFIAVKF